MSLTIAQLSQTSVALSLTFASCSLVGSPFTTSYCLSPVAHSLTLLDLSCSLSHFCLLQLGQLTIHHQLLPISGSSLTYSLSLSLSLSLKTKSLLTFFFFSILIARETDTERVLSLFHLSKTGNHFQHFYFNLK